MPKWMLGRTLALIGMLGFPIAGANAQNFDSRGFSSEREARNYLRQNPTGPRANAAFLALTEFRLARENPGLTRDQIISGFGAPRGNGGGRTSSSAQRQLDARVNDPY